MTPLAPGSTIGIVGGGQLGRMLALAAAQLGYRCHVFDPDPACTASRVAARQTVAPFDDGDALGRFAWAVDVVTFEFENIDAGPLEVLARHAPVHPPLSALRIAQDRSTEKRFAETQGARLGAWRGVDTAGELRVALDRVGTPAILKSRRFGYDGKGQARIDSAGEADAAWQALGARPSIVEALIPFDAEFSVLLARGRDGDWVAWPCPENVHEGGILRRSVVPAPHVPRAQIEEATAVTRAIADRLDYVGVLAAEFFATPDGPLFNEIAPRVHNSGHWTIEGASVSQFENHLRAIAGLPLRLPRLAGARVEMTNLIGADADRWAALAREDAHLHLYDKGEARAGRKMGHVTRVER